MIATLSSHVTLSVMSHFSPAIGLSPPPLTLSMPNFAHTVLGCQITTSSPTSISHMAPSSATTKPTFVKRIF